MRRIIFLITLLQIKQILSVGISCSTEDIKNCGMCNDKPCVPTTPTTAEKTEKTTKYPPCTIVLPNGAMQKYYKLDTNIPNITDGVSFTIIGGSGCQLRSLLVGGGGSSFADCGGGSGYLVYMKKPLNHPFHDVWVKPGLHGQSSIVSIDGINTTANQGQDSTFDDNDLEYGGNGYSGGEEAYNPDVNVLFCLLTFCVSLILTRWWLLCSKARRWL